MKKEKEAEPYSVERAIYRYLPLMHELVVRIQLVSDACEGRMALQPPFAREYAYFQFRRMCELLALGVLILNGDVPGVQTEKVKSFWSADKIMHILLKQHPYAFPQSMIRTAEAQTVNIKMNQVPNALTITDFNRLYTECGEVLHRGSVRGLEEEGLLTRADYERVLDWQQKIVSLMNSHAVGRANLAGLFLVDIKSTNGLPRCDFMSGHTTGNITVQTYIMELASGDPIEPCING